MTAVCWRAASASERGSSHRGEAPNQDAVGLAETADADGAPVWLAAVSDGHGGRRYVRSDVGARLAVHCALDALHGVVPATTWTDDRTAEDLLRGTMPGVVAAWRAAVTQDLAERPFTDQEVAQAGVATLDGEPLIAYGATLIAAVVSAAGIAVAQIGDGDVLVRTSGFAIRPVPGDDRLVAGETTSLCLDSAEADFRFASLPPSAEPDLVLLASDGYGNSFASADWWHGLVDDLAWFVGDQGFDTFRDHFSSWLAESALVGGDDASSVVLVRDPLAVDPPERDAAPASRGPLLPVTIGTELPPARTLIDPDLSPPASPRRRRGRVWLVVAAAVLLGALVAIGVALIRDRPDSSPAPGVGSSVPADPGASDGGDAASDPGDGHLSGPSAPATSLGPVKHQPIKRHRR